MHAEQHNLGRVGVEIHHQMSPDDRHLLTDSDTLEGGAVLPGFALAVGDVFNI